MKTHFKNTFALTLFFFTGILTCLFITACGGTHTSTDPSATNQAVSEKKKQNSSLPIPEQLEIILTHKDIWMNGDASDGEPDYSLMDLDQNGRLELIVYSRQRKPCTTFYEVTESRTLQEWSADGELPQAELSIFHTTNKADCYYNAADDSYHYIVRDSISLSKSEADVSFLELTPKDQHITFKKIGKYTFGASRDGEYHYFDNSGKECEEKELTNAYRDMTKKTMYYAMKEFSKEETLTAELLSDTLWDKYLLRDDYRCEKENELTDELRHQFVSLSICSEDYVKSSWKPDDTIRYTATDLDNDGSVELIIENTAEDDFVIYENNDDSPDDEKWNTRGKKLESYTKTAANIDWQTCTVSEFQNQDWDLTEDLLRECWLKFQLS